MTNQRTTPAKTRPAIAKQGRAEELLAQVADRDAKAFELLYDQYSGAVYGLARRLLSDPDQAAAVAQQCFVEIWTRADTFDAANDTASSWIFALAHRRAVERLRSLHRSTAGKPSPNPEATPGDGEIEAGQRHNYMQTLTEMQNNAVTSAYYSGHTCSEIATLTHTEQEIVRDRIRSGMIRLRTCTQSAEQADEGPGVPDRE